MVDMKNPLELIARSYSVLADLVAAISWKVQLVFIAKSHFDLKGWKVLARGQRLLNLFRVFKIKTRLDLLLDLEPQVELDGDLAGQADRQFLLLAL